MPNKKKIKIILGKNLLLIAGVSVLLIVFVFFIAENTKINNKRKNLEAEIMSLQDKMEQTQQEEESFKAKIIQSNKQEYLEKVAREELNLKKEGESVVAFPVVDENDSPKPQDEEQQNLWQKIMDKIR